MDDATKKALVAYGKENGRIADTKYEVAVLSEKKVLQHGDEDIKDELARGALNNAEQKARKSTNKDDGDAKRLAQNKVAALLRKLKAALDDGETSAPKPTKKCVRVTASGLRVFYKRADAFIRLPSTYPLQGFWWQRRWQRRRL